MNKVALVGMPVVLLALGCGGDKPPPKPPEQPVAQKEPPRTTSAPPKQELAVNVDDEIMKKCNLKVAAMPEESAKFDFDSDEVTPAERQVLEQVAKCLTTGPLKGRSVDLVGRADPRGEHEYNMSLGGRRARSVNNFLGQLGVPSDKMHDTSRGALDATGTDEGGWRLDRRVDVKLRP